MAVISIEEVKRKVNKNVIYQFRVDIKGAKPPIWRRVQVEKKIVFGEFHFILQNIFNWEGYHMHQFFIDDKTIITDTEGEYYEPIYENEIEESEVKLSEFFKKEGDKMIYNYDFGDDWDHEVKLEKILDRESKKNYPYLVTGKRIAPIEDCGGIWSWENICEAMRNKNHPERKEILEYINEFDPSDFTKEDIDEINKLFKTWNC